MLRVASDCWLIATPRFVSGPARCSTRPKFESQAIDPGLAEPSPRVRGQAAKDKKSFAGDVQIAINSTESGSNVGPDLAALTNKSSPRCSSPSGSKPRRRRTVYQYVAMPGDGRTLVGCWSAKAATALRCENPAAKTMCCCARITSSTHGKSVMPEGLENDLSQDGNGGRHRLRT